MDLNSLIGLQGGWKPHADAMNARASRIDEQALLESLHAEAELRCVVRTSALKSIAILTKESAGPEKFTTGRIAPYDSLIEPKQHAGIRQYFEPAKSAGWNLWSPFAVQAVECRMPYEAVGIRHFLKAGYAFHRN